MSQHRQLGDVPGAAALRLELSAGPENVREVPEEPIVIEDPMERRGRHDRVDRLRERQRFHEVGGHVRHPVRAEALPRPFDHRSRSVERDDLPRGQELVERRRHAAGAAPGVPITRHAGRLPAA